MQYLPAVEATLLPFFKRIPISQKDSKNLQTLPGTPVLAVGYSLNNTPLSG
jgi:hypothetical protein